MPCRIRIRRAPFTRSSRTTSLSHADNDAKMKGGGLLQQARRMRAVHQGRQGRDQMDATVRSLLRRQRCAPSASRAGLQSRQLPAHAGDALADKALVYDHAARKADQDRREGGRHARYVSFQMAEVAIPRNLFADILRLIAELRPPPVTSTAQGVQRSRVRCKPRETCASMTGKSELSALGAPLSSNWGSLASASKIQPCQQPSKAAISGSRPPVSGECRLIVRRRMI